MFLKKTPEESDRCETPRENREESEKPGENNHRFSTRFHTVIHCFTLSGILIYSLVSGGVGINLSER